MLQNDFTTTPIDIPNAIIQSFNHKYPNGFTEGVNNTIKVIKRIGYGYRNFENFRKRIMTNLSYLQKRDASRFCK